MKPSQTRARDFWSAASQTWWPTRPPCPCRGWERCTPPGDSELSSMLRRRLSSQPAPPELLSRWTKPLFGGKCVTGNSQAAALTAMGHFKAPTIHKQVCRSRSRDQSSSEFWNKVGKFFTRYVRSFHCSFCILSELVDWEKNPRAWTVWWASAGVIIIKGELKTIVFIFWKLRRPSVPEISTIDTTNKHLKASRSKSYNTREENYRVIKCERLNKEKNYWGNRPFNSL